MWQFVIRYHSIFSDIYESPAFDHYPTDEEIEAALPDRAKVVVVYAQVEKRYYIGDEHTRRAFEAVQAMKRDDTLSHVIRTEDRAR